MHTEVYEIEKITRTAQQKIKIKDLVKESNTQYSTHRGMNANSLNAY